MSELIEREKRWKRRRLEQKVLDAYPCKFIS